MQVSGFITNGVRTRGSTHGDSLISQPLGWNPCGLQWNHGYLSSVQLNQHLAGLYICVSESAMGNSPTFPLLPCAKLLGWIVQSKQIITVIFCKYNCPLRQVEDKTLLPRLISRCHNLSLSISQLGHILNAFQISGVELRCFTCIDHQCNLTHQSLQHLPLQIHLLKRLKKGRFSLLFIADHLLLMKIILVEKCGCS